MFHTRVVQTVATHILCYNFFSEKNMPFFEIMWKNIIEPDRPQMITRRMRIACWVPKATHTHTHTHTHTPHTHTHTHTQNM